MPTGKGGSDFVRIRAGSAFDAESVTPDDANDLPKVASETYEYTLGLYVGASGDVSVVLGQGTTITFTGLAGGVIHPIAATRVRSSGTTATGIVAVYEGTN